MTKQEEPNKSEPSNIENEASVSAVERFNSVGKTHTTEMRATSSADSTSEPVVEGSSQLYVQHDGEWVRRYVPMPTYNPRDPLNLPTWRKALAIGALCLFGAVNVASEAILGSLIPLFVLEYAGLDRHMLDHMQGDAGPPHYRVAFLATLPALIVGVSSYANVPLSIGIRRKPVIILCGALGWTGAIWACRSQSLESHLAARCVQAIGAGTVEALIPLSVQDMIFIHERNRCFSLVWVAQALILITFGICAPYIVVKTSWRCLYYIFAGLSFPFWIGICLLLPETRFFRSRAELQGRSEIPLNRALRPAVNIHRHGPRIWRDKFGLGNLGYGWLHAGEAVLASFKSFFPNVFWAILINGALSAMLLTASSTAALILLTEPNSWGFDKLGLSTLPVAISCVFVPVVPGWGAGKLSNYLTRRFYNGRREPEVHLVNMILPILLVIIGCIMLGAGGSYIGHVHWIVPVIGIGLLSFDLLSVNITFSAYVVECHPEWAGPLLLNVGSFRSIISFACSFRSSQYIVDIGFTKVFAVYAGVVALLFLMAIPVFVFGKATRRYCARWILTERQVAGRVTETACASGQSTETKEKTTPQVNGADAARVSGAW